MDRKRTKNQRLPPILTAVLFFILPPLFLYILFVIYPLLDIFHLCLYKWRGVTKGKQIFIGLKNFQELFHDEIFWKSLSNNLIVFILATVLSVTIALFFATVLSRKIKGTNFYRSTWLFPNLLGDVIIATIWLFIYHPTLGLLNGFLKFIGLGGFTKAWLGNSSIALYAVALPMIWKYLGFYIILFLAAIQEIPQSMVDGARIDGAGSWQLFRYIILPMLRQTIGVAIVFVMWNSFDVIFTYVKLLTKGGPGRATEVLPTYIYQQAFGFHRFGYSSTIGVVGFIFILALAAFVMRVLIKQAIGEGVRA